MINRLSLRYGGSNNLRTSFIKLCGILQRRKVVFLDSDPILCGQVLAASDKKGSFVEGLVAAPAWFPIYSLESMDGEIWEILSQNCKKIIAQTQWKERLGPIIQDELAVWKKSSLSEKNFKINAESISRFVVRALYTLIFRETMFSEDEDLFYLAANEWRKELGVKGKGNSAIKHAFWERLKVIVAASPFKEGLEKFHYDTGLWLSAFAQPFLISPQINSSDIMVAVFHFLRKDPILLQKAKEWSLRGETDHLNALLMESIRLQHPFPIVEREIEEDLTIGNLTLTAGTHAFILFDQFQQDQNFNPERWLVGNSQNPHSALPFGSGRRICLGKAIAQVLLADMLQGILSHFPDEQICPQEGHIFSGRNNDQHRSLKESIYQIKVFAGVLYKCFCLGFLKYKRQIDGSLSPSPSKRKVH